MPEKRVGWKNQKERWAQGDRSMLVVPLDYVLLQKLPEEGEMVAGLYPLGNTVKALQKEMKIDQGVIVARLRSLLNLGLTVVISALGSDRTHAWQKTKLGREVLEEWLKTQKEQ